MNVSVYLISGGFPLVYVGTAGACGLWYSSFVRPLSGPPAAHTAMFCVSVYCIPFTMYSVVVSRSTVLYGET